MKLGLPVALFVAVLLVPAGDDLPGEGQRVLAVVALAVGLWLTAALPLAVTGLIAIALLAAVRSAGNATESLSGFTSPVVLFLIGILTLAMAVYRSGLAERLAGTLMTWAGGRPRPLYAQMVFSFALLAYILPSATTRTAIMVHIYNEVLDRWQVGPGAPLAKAVMIAQGSLNRLGSTALLAGGITPVVASGLIGDFSWGRWFVLMAVPFYAMLALGSILAYLMYRSGFQQVLEVAPSASQETPLTRAELWAATLASLTAILWFTDKWHGLHPVIPAAIALGLALMPRIGLVPWRYFARHLEWRVVVVVATSLSLGDALTSSGAADWVSENLIRSVIGLADSPRLALLALVAACAVVRLLIPSIVGYLAVVIPIAMAASLELGLNPMVAALGVVVVGDAVVYYPAQSGSSLVAFLRGGLTTLDVFFFGLIMTVVALFVLMAVAVPYWGLVGEGLTG